MDSKNKTALYDDCELKFGKTRTGKPGQIASINGPIDFKNIFKHRANANFLPRDSRVASLIHEELHAVTGLNDGDLFALFTKYGLSDANFKLWPHPTQELSDWIRNGCPK